MGFELNEPSEFTKDNPTGKLIPMDRSSLIGLTNRGT